MNLELVTGGFRMTPEEKREMEQKLKELEEREELALKALYNIQGGGPTPFDYR